MQIPVNASPTVANPELRALIERAKSHTMTPAERKEQRISFIYGLLPSRSKLTKDDVRRWVEERG